MFSVCKAARMSLVVVAMDMCPHIYAAMYIFTYLVVFVYLKGHIHIP